jgi:NAD+ diphosphatase
MDHYKRSALNFFAAPTIDRSSHRRRDDAWVADRLQDPDTRLVPVWGSKNLFADDADKSTPRPILLAPPDLGDLVHRAESITLLGEADSRAYFAVGLRSDSPDADSGSESVSPPAELAEMGRFRDLRRIGALLDRWEGALLAYARAITYWHHRHRFCGSCGSPTTSASAGHLRVCGNAECGQQHFPRTDPAIIVLVTSGERCLLGRQAVWPPKMYSTIAGFVEPGESLEAAVVREVLEETSVRVEEIMYHSSQPWPFPSSLMLGFTARAADDAIQLNDGELEDARWLSREEMQVALQDETLRLPTNASISYRLIEDWFDAGGAGRLGEHVHRRRG